MDIPPGFIFLAQVIPQLVLLPAALFWISKSFFGNVIPRWLHISASLLAFPTVMYLNSIIVRYRHQRQARLRGAVLAPSVSNRWPAGIDRLAELVDDVKNGYMGELHDKIFREYGNTVCLRILFEDRILTSEPEHIKPVIATQFSAFMKGNLINDQLNSLLGTGVFNSDGDVWKFHRSMTRPFFNKDRVSDFDIFEKHADDAINQLKVRLREGYPVDFQDMMLRFTLDSATEFLFGRDVRSLSVGLVYPPYSPLSQDPAILHHPSNEFVHALHEAQVRTALRTTFGSLWRMREFWKDKVQKEVKVCYEFIDPILKEALEKKNRDGFSSSSLKTSEVQEGDTLLDHLVRISDHPVIIKDETMNILLAGRDSTATTTSFIIYMLSQNPEVMRRLREEILSKIGPSRRPTLEDMRDMKYMRAVINETLRLYPPVPINLRTCRESTVLPAVNGEDPIFVPANTLVIFSVYLMHRSRRLWGPDALKFDPDRFLDERLQKYLSPNPFIFIPFNAGPRICPGQQFAYNEISFFLIRLLQNFSSVSLDLKTQTLPPAEWANEPGRKGIDKIIFKSHLTSYIQNGLWVKMEEATTTA